MKMGAEKPGPVTAESPGTGSSPARVLPLLSHTGNRRVLLEWLRRQDRYEVFSGEDDRVTLSEGGFDVVIADKKSLREYGREVRERKADSEAFLPVLLVGSDATEGLDTRRTETEKEVSPTVDEVLTTPIEYAELRNRLDALTRIRAQSVSLRRRTEQLLLLNRITRHDIRNDMNIILSWTEQLEGHTEESGDRIRRRILDSGQHVVDLTKAVREFVEALQTADDPELRPTDLEGALTDELTRRRETFGEAEFVVRGGVPEGHVMANDTLGSVFRNVLNNAVQHNESEGPRVEVNVVEDEETVAVTVADNGTGIPPDRRDAVLGRTDEGIDHPLAGLGLYLVDTLVTQYGGAVRIRDSDTGGAAVEIELKKPQDGREGGG
jgi:signal transduction histidine kinase